ncbi:MAG: hypothetical protein ACRDOH_31165 [Streptosporangiaceae bacterium]
MSASPAGKPATQVLVVPVAGITAEPFPGRRPDRPPVAGHRGGGVGAEGEGGCFFPVHHQPCCGLMGAEMGQVVGGQLGATWRSKTWASSGEQLKNTLFRALADSASRSSRGS